MAEQGYTGGIIYDALIVKAANKADVTNILTFNTKDFKRVTVQHCNVVLP